MPRQADRPTAPRLLVVDDDLLQVKIIGKVASQIGFEVTFAQSAEAAIEAISAADFSHVTVDLSLGERDGVELLRWIASRRHVPNVIVISGCEERILISVLRMARSTGLGDARALAKPIDLALLHDALSQARPDGGSRRSNSNPREMITVAHLQRAISEDEIYPVFQPKLDLATGRLIGCEALARWNSAEFGIVRPDVFIALAERRGLIGPLTLLMLDRSISAMRNVIAQNPEFVLAVNLSATLLPDLSLPDEIERILSNHDVPARSLMFEVTESTSISDLSQATDVLLRLRIRGIGLSLDDFGTGYSSLSVLARMPFSELKIDRTFVGTCLTDPDMWKIVRGSIALAHEFGMKVVAEGIEDRETCEALRKVGCDVGQGFLFAPGLSKAEFDSWRLDWGSRAACSAELATVS
jgi:EAL domain-containing protein (putative c-di-GMP-specific phosphodiesterase class I)